MNYSSCFVHEMIQKRDEEEFMAENRETFFKKFAEKCFCIENKRSLGNSFLVV